MSKYTQVIILFFFFVIGLKAQVTLTVRINSGNSATSCTDGFFGGAPEPQWRVNVANQGWTTYPQAGICFTNPPNTEYTQTYDCPSAYPANIQVCFRAFEDDGAVCVVSESCLEQICQNYPTPAPGTSATYTLSIPAGTSTGSVNFTITATGSFSLPGSAYDQICNAVNLGTLNSGSSVGNDGLSNRGNFCAGNAGDPSPWSNQQGVWFQFTTSNNPAATMRFNAVSDPQNLGDGIDLQLALYSTSNGTCSGSLNLIRQEYDGLGTIWDEEMFVDCLLPNTTYWLMVDGESNLFTNNGIQGFFGLEIYDNGVVQAGDQICNAQHLGTVPAGGNVATANLSQTNICATNTNDPNPGNWTSDQSVWFSFNAPPSGHVIIEAQSDLIFPLGTDAVDLQVALYSTNNNTCTGTLQYIDSDYDPIIFDEDLDVQCLDPGRRYYVLIDGSGLNVSGIFDLTIRDGGVYPASNDSICNAIALGAPLPNATVGLNNQNNYCADNLFEPIPANWGNDQGVWYTFIAPPSGKVEIRLENLGLFSDQIDLQVAVYDAQNQACTDPLTEIMSEYDGFGLIWDETAEVECLIPGRLYYILVDGQGSLINPDLQEGTFNIEVWADPRDPAGPNNEPCNAIALGNPNPNPVGTTAGPQHGSQNNFCATATGEPVPGGFNPDQTVWYTFVAPPTGNVRIRAISDDIFSGVDAINLQLAVWETTGAGCNGPWREVQSGDDLLSYNIDMEVYCLEPGQTYYIQVDGAPPALIEGHEGYFDLNISELPAIPVAPNDLICNAISMGNPFAGPVTLTNQHNLCADDIGDPQPSAFGTDQTVWYSFTTPPTGGPYAVDIELNTGLPWPFGNGSIDLQVAVFSSSNNTCTGTLTEVDSDYDPIIFDEDIRVQCLLPNTTYYVMVDGSWLDPQGNFDITIRQAPSVPIPVNDLICNYVDLGLIPVGGSVNNNVNYSNFCADIEPGEPSPFGIDQTVWFSFLAPQHPGANATSEVTVIVRSDPNNVGDAVDLQLAVYESSNNACNGSLSLVREGSDDPLFSFNAEVNTTCLVPGRRYFVQVDGTILNMEGYFTIQIQDDGSGYHPPYDTICNAVALGAVPNGSAISNGTLYTNLCATTEAAEPNPAAFNPNQTVWFTFEAPSSGNVTIDLFSNSSDAINLQLSIYQAQNNSCQGPWLEIDSDYDGILFDESMSLECLIPGQLYYIQVDGEGSFGGDEGNFTIRIQDDGGNTVFPYNNDICNARNFGVPPGAFNTINNETNECANVQFGEPGVGSYADHTVWYQFTAPPSGRVEIEVVSTNLLTGMDPEVYVFASSNNGCTGNFTRVESSNWPTALITENITAECLIPGNTYFIQVDGSGLVEEGRFNIRIRDMEPLYGTGLAGDPEPVNNQCVNAINIAVQSESCANANGTWSTYNYGQATITYNPPFVQGCGQNCGETWYSFTMPSSGIALVEGNDDGVGNGFPFGDFSDLHVVAYTGSCGNLNPIACGSGGLTNDVGFEVAAAPGSTVYLQVFNDGGSDDNEDYQLCVSQGCGADNCLNAVAFPIQPNIPYCFNTSAANGEDVSGGTPGYFECGEGDNPENSLYYYFVSDCNGSAVTLNVINATASGGCILGTIPNDGFNISFFQDPTPCDNNPTALVDCQNFNSCMVQPINWSFTYNNLQPNTPYIIQIDGGFNFLGGDNQGYIMIQTTTNPVVVPTSTAATCSGGGTATATTLGGVAPFTFLWSNGATDSIATNLSPGSYTVTVTSSGGFGCTDTATVTIASPLSFNASISNATNSFCSNSCTGTATATATGGTILTGYTYLWSANAQTTSTATGLCPGYYTVTVYDNGGCSDTVGVLINGPASILDLSLISQSDVSCQGICNGTATVLATGGTIFGSYQYAWSSGNTTATANNLCFGIQTVTVTDDNNCTDTLQFNVGQLVGIQTTLDQSVSVTCFGGNDGSFVLSTSNGSAPYLYTMNGLTQSNGSYAGLSAGIYFISVTDNNGCEDTLSIQLTEPQDLIPQVLNLNQINCFGGNSGSITLGASGGTTPYLFAIDSLTTSANNVFANLSAGTYDLYVYDQNGCSDSTQITLTEPSAIQINLLSQTSSNCGVCDGSANINLTGGSSPYSFSWSNGETVEDPVQLCAGNAIVTVTDANGCTASTNVNITNSAGFSISSTITSNSCFGQCQGLAQINTNTGTAPYQYLWSNGATSSSISQLCSGTYFVTVVDANACIAVEPILISNPDSLEIQFQNILNPSCFGLSNGQISGLVNGGVSPYQYNWSNGGFGNNLINISSGNYSLTVTDQNGCTTSSTTSLTDPSQIQTNFTNISSSDCGTTACTGSATINVSGAAGPFQYLWSNGSVINNPSNLCPNFNFVTITDQNGCSVSTSVNIPSNSTLGLIVTSSVQPSCFGLCNGSISVSANGGNTTAPYTYVWSNGSISNTLTGLCAGNYRVTVSDIDACTNAVEITITEPTAVQTTLQSAQNYNGFDISCFGLNNGSINTITSGGNSPYNFIWSSGQNSSNITGLNAGIYTLTTTDANNCTVVESITLTEPNSLNLILSSTNVTCFGASNASVNTILSGGVAPYTYLWSTGSTGTQLSNLGVGNIVLTVTDANQCQVTNSVLITQPNAIQIISNITAVTCNGASDGQIDISLNNGTAPYLFVWSNAATTEDLQNIAAGTYQVTVTDANACTASQTFVLSNPSPIIVQSLIDDVNCRFSNDGSITLTVTGGNSPYQYLWSNAATGSTNSGLIAGSYSVTVTDANLCQVVNNFVVNQPNTVVVANILSSTTLSCYGDQTARIDADAYGGTPNYTFIWSNGATTEDLTGLGAGVYTMTATDQLGCSATTSLVINQPDSIQTQIQLLSNYNGSAVSCAGAQDASIGVVVQGGTAPYQLIWNLSPNVNTSTLTAIGAGTYTVSVTDARSCSVQRSYTIIEPLPLQAQFNSTQVSCNRFCDGSITVLPTLGTGTIGINGYEYRIIGPGQPGNVFTYNNQFTNLCAGTYTVEMRDGNNCTISQVITITQPSQLNLTLQSASVTCSSGQNGSVRALVAGGTAPYTYLWSNGESTQQISSLSTGIYFITVTDRNLCTVSSSVSVSTLPSLSVNINTQAVSCYSGNDGRASALVSGGTQPYSFIWSNGSSGSTAFNLSAGIVSVTVTDANLCTATAQTLVSQSNSLTVNLISDSVSCFGGTDGSVSSQVNGGVLPYQYLWSSGQTTSQISGVQAGSYILRVVDALGCEQTVSAQVFEPAVLRINLLSYTNIGCFNTQTGTAQINIVGGTSPYQFVWSSGETTQNATALSSGIQSVTVTDANGCQTDLQVTILSANPLNIVEIQTTAVNCYQGSDGTATVICNGGSTPYDYLWSTNETTQSISGLTAGLYQVTVTDRNGCSVSSSVVIEQPLSVLAGYLNSNNTLCSGANSGQITAVVTGGTLQGAIDYQYIWNDGGSGAIRSGLSSGIYIVTVTDLLGCSLILTDTIQDATPIQLQLIQVQQPTCLGGQEGQAQVSAQGGTGTLTYQWSDGQLGTTATGLSAGNYIVTVTDSNGCTDTLQISLIEADSVQLPVDLRNVSCFGYNDGRIHITSAGASLYYWSNGSVGTPLSNIEAGQYTLTVVMNNGCSARFVYNVSQPAELVSSILVDQPISCHNELDGRLSALAQGGSPNYLYRWSNGNNTRINDDLGSGTYRLIVIDANGCRDTSTLALTNPPPLVLSGQAFDLNCIGDQNGSLRLQTIGGSIATGPYQYNLIGTSVWQSSNQFNQLGEGTYQVRVRDNNGCMDTIQLDIQEANPFYFTGLASDTTIEYGDSISIWVSLNDSNSVQYLWTDLYSQNIIDSLHSNFLLWPTQQMVLRIEARNLFGCLIDSTVMIRVDKPRRVGAPQGFTPNQDGNNDRFYIQSDDKVAKILQFRVFDRWGEQVFLIENVNTNDPQYGWDGTLNGVELSSGVYAWFAEVLFIDGHVERIKGDVSLLK